MSVGRLEVMCRDWLCDEVPIEQLAELLLAIYRTPYLQWRLPAPRDSAQWARLQRVHDLWPILCPPVGVWLSDWLDGHVPANVVLLKREGLAA